MMRKYWQVALVAFFAAAVGGGTVLGVGIYLVNGVAEPRYDLLSNQASYRASISHDSSNTLALERRSSDGNTYYGDVVSFDMDAPADSLKLTSDATLEIKNGNSFYSRLRLRSNTYSDWYFLNAGSFSIGSSYNGDHNIFAINRDAPSLSLWIDSSGDTIAGGNVECDEVCTGASVVAGTDVALNGDIVFLGSGTSPATDAFVTSSNNGDVVVQLGN